MTANRSPPTYNYAAPDTFDKWRKGHAPFRETPSSIQSNFLDQLISLWHLRHILINRSELIRAGKGRRSP
jgi:hypothetical protein